MDTTIQVLKKTADYIEQAQPLIDQYNELRIDFAKRAEHAAQVLARHGIITGDKVDAFAKQAAAEPTKVWDFVEKLALALSADSLGGGTQEKLAASGKDYDAFERLVLFGDSKSSGAQSGMVD